MRNTTVVDASLGPPYDLPPASSSSGPPPPNNAVVSSATTRLFVGQEYGNLNGVMHGGAAGVIFDMLTTIALGPVARPDFWAWVPPASLFPSDFER